MGGPHWGIDIYRPFNYISDFAESWLEGVYMSLDDRCEIISLSDHYSKLVLKNPNPPYMSIIG